MTTHESETPAGVQGETRETITVDGADFLIDFALIHARERSDMSVAARDTFCGNLERLRESYRLLASCSATPPRTDAVSGTTEGEGTLLRPEGIWVVLDNEGLPEAAFCMEATAREHAADPASKMEGDGPYTVERFIRASHLSSQPDALAAATALSNDERSLLARLREFSGDEWKTHQHEVRWLLAIIDRIAGA